MLPPPTLIRAQDTPIGKGCTTAFYIDNDCDGYGVGLRSDGNYASRSDSGGLIGDMPDADDNDTQVNTPESVIHKYGDLRSFLIDGKGYNVSNIYYIALDGIDLSGQPNNPDKPFRHWYQAEGNTQYGVKHLLKPGDVVVYRGGKYDDPVISISSATEENPIVAMSHPGETVIFDSIIVAVSIR